MSEFNIQQEYLRTILKRFIFNNYSPKAKWITGEYSSNGIITTQIFSQGLSRIIVLVKLLRVCSWNHPVKKKKICGIYTSSEKASKATNNNCFNKII